MSVLWLASLCLIRIKDLATSHLVHSYLETLQIPLKDKGLLEQIDERIGSLGKPGKMPGYSWSIPASYCITGSKLALIEGTPCFSCYAKKGRYKFKNVQNALEYRFEKYKTDVDWTSLMTIRLLLLSKKNQYFRWFDSGDLQSTKMFQDICLVAEQTRGCIKHWLPTQERSFVKQHLDDIPSNLTVRISSTVVGKEVKSFSEKVQTSSVGNQVLASTCPSRQQNNNCGDCRMCWDKRVSHIVYEAH